MSKQIKQMIFQKLTSRKFWIAVAFFLASVGTSVKSLNSPNPIVQAIGIICGTLGTALSAAIYSSNETKVDVARLSNSQEVANESTGNKGAE